MLFNSLSFILLFLPLALLGFYVLGRAGRTEAQRLFIIAASMVFYAIWSVKYLGLLLCSAVINYHLGKALFTRASKPLLALGIGFNLSVLAYFKYAGFLSGVVADLTHWPVAVATLAPPLAISFFTFQKIAYLVSSFRRTTHADSFSQYLFFVLFFPQLIAGPIVHYEDIKPQITADGFGKPHHRLFVTGLILFIIGLLKKTLIADSLHTLVGPLFTLSAQGVTIGTWSAWEAAFGYSLQIYFDFSGYCDMAIGLAMLFGILLPFNFDSPYKATSIIDFWRRWHITLSRFLRDYLYIPLGGSRKGIPRQYLNVMVVMLLGGLWHGAGWQFILWGGLHGALIVINHIVRSVFPAPSAVLARIFAPVARGVTFFSVSMLWIFFNAPDISTGWHIFRQIFIYQPFELSNNVFAAIAILTFIVLPLILFTWCAPNSQTLAGRLGGVLTAPSRGAAYRYGAAFGTALGMCLIAIMLGSSRAFIYFQF